MSKEYIIPSSAADLADIKKNATEYANAMVMQQASKDHTQAIIDLVAEKYDLPKAIVKKLFNTYSSDDFTKTQENNDKFETLYISVFDTNKQVGGSDDKPELLQENG